MHGDYYYALGFRFGSDWGAEGEGIEGEYVVLEGVSAPEGYGGGEFKVTDLVEGK